MGETAQVSDKQQGLFSSEERRAIVRSFIEQYLAGKINITRWDPTRQIINIRSGIQQTGEERLEAKKNFEALIEVSCGIERQMPEISVQQAVDLLFDDLVMFRGGQFIKGEFPVTPITDSRLQSVEKRIESIEKLFEELMQRLKVQGQGSDPP